MEVLAIIPARGGSKGIPGKNLKKVGGLSLLARSVRAACKAKAVARVVVSTDAVDIAEEARLHGAEVVVRPDSLSGDQATSESALLHVLEQLKGEGYSPDCIVFQQCTTPFVSSQDIDSALEQWVREAADCLFSAVLFEHFAWECEPGGSARGISHDPATRARRQDKAPQYLENGAFYIMRRDGFEQAQHRFFGKIAVHLMDRHSALEIDDPADLSTAQMIAPIVDKINASAVLPENPAAVIFDFDGVFTDNRVWVDETGKESVVCSRGDGYGLELLRKFFEGELLVVSKEQNPVVEARCQKLKINCYQGIESKGPLLEKWSRERGIDLDRCIYMGNDLNDLPCFEQVGCSVAPADAEPEVLASADLVLNRCGGHGAVRELCEIILSHLSRELK
ncbi:MAG: acylneuraminate cytidylyltransferase [Opitutales bacterium]|nr:acylneuraminate cytidylyltransferase [Opitutales bacterium]